MSCLLRSGEVDEPVPGCRAREAILPQLAILRVCGCCSICEHIHAGGSYRGERVSTRGGSLLLDVQACPGRSLENPGKGYLPARNRRHHETRGARSST